MCPGTTWRARRSAIAVILVGGRFLMRPLFRAIGGAKTPEVFTTVALLIVAGTALLATAAGLSPSLGAFMAGVLLSESEYRHELQADIEPFEGLLLGFFFISVGMSADLPLARAQPALLAAATAALLVAKAVDRASCWRASPAQDTAERAALRPRPAAGQRVQLRAVRRRGRRRRARSRAMRHSPRWSPPPRWSPRRSCSPAPKRFWPRLKRAPAPEYDTIDAEPDAGDHLRLRPLRADRRPRAAHARHRVHRAGAQPRPGRGRAPLRHQGVFRRSHAARRVCARPAPSRRSCWW